MTLIEREQEMALLAALLDDCARGRGSAVLISGAVGSGRTELLHAFTESAVGSGAHFLRATAAPEQSGVPLGIVDQLFATAVSVPGHGDRIAGLLESPDFLAALDDVAEDPTGYAAARIQRRLGRELAKITRDAPLVIGVDDVQHSDALSFEWLRRLMWEPRVPRVMLVLTERFPPSGDRPIPPVELLRESRFQRVRIGPLSEGGVTEMLGRYLDERSVRRVASEVHRVSGGNPLLVRTILADSGVRLTWRPERESLERVTAGPMFRLAVLRCLDRSGAAIRTAARVLATLGPSTTPELLDRMLETVPAGTAGRALEALTSAGLVEGHEFRHPEAHAAVLSNLPAEERASLHRRAARLLDRSGADAGTVVRHLPVEFAGRDSWSVSMYEAAAAQAFREGRRDTALAHMDAALDLCGDDRREVELTLTMIRMSGPSRVTVLRRHIDRLTQAVADGTLGGRRAAEVVKAALWFGRLDAAVAATTTLLASDDADDLLHCRAWLSVAFPTFAERFTGLRGGDGGGDGPADPGGSRPRAARALEEAVRGGDPDAVMGATERLRDQRIDQSTSEPITQALLALTYSGRLAEAARWCDELFGQVTAAEQPAWYCHLVSARARISLRQGDLPRARQLALSALTSSGTAALGVGVGGQIAVVVAASSLMGRPEEAAEWLGRELDDLVFQTPFGLEYLHARGHHYLLTGRPNAAVEDFLRCGELLARWGMDTPRVLPWRTSAAEAHLAAGAEKRARELVEEQRARLAPGPCLARGAVLRLSAAMSKPGVRLGELREAVDVLESAGERIELVKAMAGLGETYYKLGDPSRSRVILQRAWELANACGAGALSARFDHALYRRPHEAVGAAKERRRGVVVGGAGDRTGELSEAERRVARLASQGYTNRQIGERLYISVSTVEQHLTRVYRKLAVRHRTEIPSTV